MSNFPLECSGVGNSVVSREVVNLGPAILQPGSGSIFLTSAVGASAGAQCGLSLYQFAFNFYTFGFRQKTMLTKMWIL